MTRLSVWLAGLAFGMTAFLVKLIFYPAPDYNPPALYGLVSGFIIGAAGWYLWVARPEKPTLLRGGLTGALAGLVTPAIMWILFGLILPLADPSASDALGWSFAYALLTFTRLTAWLSAVFGGALGIALIRSQENFSAEAKADMDKRREDRNDDGTNENRS